MNTNALETSGHPAAVLTAKPLRLYDVADALNAIDQQLEESEGDLTPEIEAALEVLQGAFVAKVEAVCLLRQNAIAEADMCAAESERLRARAKAAQKKADSLRTFLFGAFQRAGETKIKTARWTVYIQASPPSIRWTRRIDEVPIGYRRVTVEVNIARAHEDLKAGDVLPDGFVVEQSNHIRIR